MFTSKFLSRIGTIAIVLMLALGNTQPALAQAPSNDYFADATTITSLPFSSSTFTMMATYEPGELYPDCGYGYQPNSVWYKYTSPTNVTLTAQSSDYYSVLAIYTGSAVDSLTRVSCRSYYPQIILQAQANVTYYFQLSYLYPWYYGNIPFSLQITPPPTVYIQYSPYDPSMFDTVYFNAWVNDPAGIYGNTYAWTLGDGTTSSQSSFYHQFAADGDYAASLTFTTYDGRSNTANATVQVRTRDVAITKFSVPQTAKSNTTKEITVEVANRRYSDNVQVQLFKGLPGGGEQLIGTLTIYVPARATRATLFKFSYTFTGCDAAVGKVTFRTIATLMNSRDALPADNTAIRTTLVTGTGTCSPTSYP